MSKKHLLAAVVLLVALIPVCAQQRDYLRDLSEQPGRLAGTDWLCPTGPVRLTKAPKGYKPFYISHYGRHGARYASQSDMYSRLNKLFSKAAEADNLTAFGQAYKARFDKLYPTVRYRTGDLSEKGWRHQKALAERMYANFPEAFPRGAQVRAWTSTATRCVMTMSSFCLGLKGKSPEIEVVENYGKAFLPAILPMSSENPFREKEVETTPLRFEETWDHFIDRTLDYRTILGRLFKDVDKAEPRDSQWDLTSYLWFFAMGMNSLDSDLDFKDLFTAEELLALWKVDDFVFYADAWPKHLGYMPVVKDIIAKADARIAAGEPGADLRFGHDYTFLPLLMTIGVDGFGVDVEHPDDIPLYYQTYRVPMGANIHFVFYRSRRSPEILFKVLLDGEEAHLQMETDRWPYYSWERFKQRYQR